VRGRDRPRGSKQRVSLSSAPQAQIGYTIPGGCTARPARPDGDGPPPRADDPLTNATIAFEQAGVIVARDVQVIINRMQVD
jgi:hypothetical protein